MRPPFIINEDNSHFYGSRKPDDMSLKGLNAFVDQYADTAVTHLFLCPNAMRASFRSTAREAIWDVTGNEHMPPPSERRGRWPANAKLLHERNLDPYAIWITRSREKGISPWLSMRMNDIHSVNEPNDFMHSSFWHNHPEFWRVPNGEASPWQNRAMDYAHAEVREHQMAFVDELLERYDPDGLELDWMRFAYHLSPGNEERGAGILTEFVREVRQLTETWGRKRGHRILLAARVPAHPDAARGLGMDGVTWANEGLIDMLVPCPFWASSDFEIPAELWKERIAGAPKPVLITPGLEFNSRPWPGGKPVANDLGCVRGFAMGCWDRGADGIYLFNFMDSGTRPVPASDYRILLEKGVARAECLGAIRRIPMCYRDTVPAGFPNDVRLPVELLHTKPVRLHIGTKPSSGTASIICGLAERPDIGTAILSASVNGQNAPLSNSAIALKELGGGAARAIRFSCPIDALRDGYNDLVISQTGSDKEQQLVWLEIRLEP